jgi:hypothetical protein
LKWGTIAFWNGAPSLFEMGHHRFFPRSTPTTIPPPIIPTTSVGCHFRMDLMTCKENFPSVWKNPKTVPWSGGSGTWWKWRIGDRGLGENPSFSLPSGDRFRNFSYRWKIFLACHQVHTKMAPNAGRMGVVYRGRGARRLHFDQVPDPDSSFSPSLRPPRSGDRFRNFSYRWKIFLACHQVHTKAAPNGGRRYYRGGEMIGVEDLMKIKPAKHASQSPDPRYSYAYTWNIEYWWSWGAYMHESILLL